MCCINFHHCNLERDVIVHGSNWEHLPRMPLCERRRQKSPKNRKIQIWKWDIEMETLNSSGDIIEVPHANQTSSFALHYGLLIVIPHATKDVQRRAAQRESWQMLLLERSGVGSDGDEASRFGDMVFSELHRSRKTRLSIRAAVKMFEFGLLMKTDTDSFIFLDRLLPLLEKRNMF